MFSCVSKFLLAVYFRSGELYLDVDNKFFPKSIALYLSCYIINSIKERKSNLRKVWTWDSCFLYNIITVTENDIYCYDYFNKHKDRCFVLQEVCFEKLF